MNPNKLIFLFLWLLLLSCSINDDDNNRSTIIIDLNIEHRYFDDRLTGDAILSDAEGETIEVIALENEQSYEWTIPSDGEAVFFTFVRKRQPDNASISMHSFVIKDDISISIAKNPNLNLDRDQVDIDFSQVDVDFDDISTNVLSFGGSNGMFSFEPYVFPADIIVSFKIAEETGQKVYFQEDVDASFSDVIGLDNVSDVVDSTEHVLPENASAYSILGAKRSNQDDFYQNISEAYTATSHKHYLPSAAFDEFLLETSLKKDDVIYWTFEPFTDFDFSYALPDFDFNILETSIESIQLDGGEACDYYELLFRNFSTNGFNVLWNIAGEFETSVETKLPQLEPYLQSLNPAYSNQDLDYINTTGYRISQPFEYDDFIEMKTERFESMKVRDNKVEFIMRED